MSATLTNGINLAYWLYKVHPELFKPLLSQAQASRVGLGRLGDDFSPAPSDFVPFDTSSYTPDTTIPLDTTSVTVSAGDVSAALDPVLVNLPDPALSTVGIDAALATPQVSIDSSTAPASSSSGLGNALSSLGSFLTSTAGLTSLTNLATAVYKANTPQAATVATQAARVAGGVNPAPITYGYNAAGQLVPVLNKANTAGVALNSQTLAGLIPSSLTPYVVPVVIGLVLWWAISGSKK